MKQCINKHKMPQNSKITFFIGLLFLILCVINGFFTEEITPSFLRAEILSALTSVILILIALMWKEINPVSSKKENLIGEQKLYIDDQFTDIIKYELGWGSHQILTATPAATLIIYWNNKTVLVRGLSNTIDFIPGEICKKALESGKPISLVNTTLYPGKFEFDSILVDIPSVIIYPLKSQGFVLAGGWSKRCFSKSDQIWIYGWSEKIGQLLNGSIKIK